MIGYVRALCFPDTLSLAVINVHRIVWAIGPSYPGTFLEASAMPFGTVKLLDGHEVCFVRLARCLARTTHIIESSYFAKLPTIAFGTGSTMKSKDVTDYVEKALDNGFCHIDTASGKVQLEPCLEAERYNLLLSS
jgi:hypothetical protein